MDNAQIIRDAVREKAQIITGLNRSVWEYAELGYQETKSAAAIIKALEDDGFTVTKELAGIPTAFKAVWGSGSPVVGILGEYDALPGLSQKAGVAAPEPDEGHTTGHGCGHCALGAGAVGAAMAAKAYLEQSGKTGTLVFFGCPAEEQGFGKGFMAKARCFDGVDMMFTWHPADQNVPMGTRMVANYKVRFDFTGISAHAGAAPEKGRSALDACELMNVGVNYMREHVISDARIHYAYLDNGGEAPNVVQDHAVIRYEVRSPWVSQVKDLFERVKNVARGASIMTDTTVDCELAMAFTEYIPNNALAAVADECMKEVGAPKWDEDDYAMAREFLNTYPPVTMENIKSQIIEVFGEDRLEEILERPLDSEIHPFNPDKIKLTAGSTDVGDVGYAAPTLNINIATACIGNVGHSWQMVAQTCSPLAHKGLLTAAKVMALACVRTMDRPDVIEAAKKEVTKRNGGHYTCPLPDSVMPPLDTY